MQYVTEFEVLIYVIQYLVADNWNIKCISLATGSGINHLDNKQLIKDKLIKIGLGVDNIQFFSSGEDIQAQKGNEIWKIECKGLGNDIAATTIKNNFDRAIASTVSYYTQNQDLRLGIALPEEYLNLINKKIPMALRLALNLWILLYISADRQIYSFAPGEGL